MKCRTFETCEYRDDEYAEWRSGYCLDGGKYIIDLGGDEVVDVYDWRATAIDDTKWSFDISRRMDGAGVQITNIQEHYSSVLATDFSQIELRLLATSPKDMESLQRDCNKFVRRLSDLKFTSEDGQVVELKGTMEATISPRGALTMAKLQMMHDIAEGGS